MVTANSQGFRGSGSAHFCSSDWPLLTAWATAKTPQTHILQWLNIVPFCDSHSQGTTQVGHQCQWTTATIPSKSTDEVSITRALRLEVAKALKMMPGLYQIATFLLICKTANMRLRCCANARQKLCCSVGFGMQKST